MNLLNDILAFVGFIAITFGAAGTISKWLKASEERKRAARDNHKEITATLARIEETLRHLQP